MRLARRLAVAVSVLVAGASGALLFRKDARQADEPPQRSLDNPFRQRVERRVAVGAAWARKIGGPYPAERVAPAATASISHPQGPAAESQPIFQKSSNPVGALLEPIDGVPPAEDESLGPIDVEIPRGAGDFDAGDFDAGDSAARTHRIVDGDTLTRLAIRYLGRADGYAEIFALNRDILSNPDLLPIGATLRLPRRSAPGAQPGGVPAPKVQLEDPRAVAPVDHGLQSGR